MKFSGNKMNNILIIMVMISLVIFTGCSDQKNQTQPISKTTLQFGTVIQITVFDEADAPALEKVLSHMKVLEDELSTSVENSNISLFNAADSSETIQLTDHAQAVIQRGLYYSELSGGKFDITIEPIVDLWGIGHEDARVPGADELLEATELVDYKLLDYDPQAGTLKKLKDGVKIDLGGIAKGYAADEAARILHENGVEKALINLGGNVYALGSKDGKPWKVGVQNPLDAQGTMVGIVEVEDTAVITSGVYERYFEEDGVRYHHILDPDTGYPINNEILGISIITEKAIDGDALSTLVYAKGLEAGMDFVESLDGVDAIFVSRDKTIYLSSGAAEKFDQNNMDFDLYTSATKQK
ncbi:FAD:protein FMN transferase [Fusibacter sp. JL216-2]|uniref:FAD:protein FMN transferase n=1 Tax=Fusibacter sp. JL216-2 TaxID=3071453 RepID=UPI003D350115